MTEFRLPFPPSVNEMYVTNKSGRGRGRYPSDEYKAWKDHAAWELNAQKAKTFHGRAIVHIDLDDTRQGDCDNRAKAVLDILVTTKVLTGDSKKHVKRVSIGWEKITGCRVALEAA